jgi:hypothetical protein
MFYFFAGHCTDCINVRQVIPPDFRSLRNQAEGKKGLLCVLRVLERVPSEMGGVGERDVFILEPHNENEY